MLTKTTSILHSTKQSTIFWAVLIILFGLFLRWYHWGTYPFGFDQVQILENARSILSGDFTLIGPRTGPAEMFTGPLIYYLTAVMMIAIPAPFTVVAVDLVLAAITGLVLFSLTRWTFGRATALSILFLWAASPFLVAMDRIPWNPNLSLLASCLSFLPIFHLLQSEKFNFKKSLLPLSLIGLGAFLGYQAHFSGLMLPALLFLTGLCFKRFKVAFLTALASSAGLLISLLPTVVFDWKHDWLNLKGLLALTQSTGQADVTERLRIAGHTLEIVIKNMGWIFFWDTNQVLPVVIGAALICCQLCNIWKTKDKVQRLELCLPILWIGISTLFYSVYRGDKPEYYFLIQVPAILVMLDQSIFATFRTFKVSAGLVTLLAIYALAYSLTKYQVLNGVNFANQLDISGYVHRTAEKQPITSIIYDMEPVHSLGLKYLLSDIPTQNGGSTIHLAYPYLKDSINSYSAHDLSAWVDTRLTPTYHYLTTLYYIIGSPQNVTIYPVTYPEMMSDNYDSYQIAVDQHLSYDLWVISQAKHHSFDHFWVTNPSLQQKENTWQYVTNTEFSGWVYNQSSTFYLVPIGSANKDSVVSLLDSLQLYH